MGFRGLLLEPDVARAAVLPPSGSPCSLPSPTTSTTPWTWSLLIITGPSSAVVLRDALATKARWVGIMGNPHHVGPHVAMLTELGVPAEEIARVHRPIGLNIGSRIPPEIAVATLAGLLADRNGRPGGFEF